MTTSAPDCFATAHDALFDVVGDVGNRLDRAAQEVAVALSGDDSRVDLAGGDVVAARQVLVDEALVVSQVEIGFSAIVGDVTFAVLERETWCRGQR